MIINKNRYEKMEYRRLGKSGIKLPVMTLGLWHNFGANDDYENCKEIIIEAFNNGITHFDLANNYGPPAGSAEITFGKILKDGLMDYRDELIITTKAGYGMWDGPYQTGGSRKYLISSLDQSLERMGLSYVDIFYHHVPDKETNLYETALALRDIVLQGKALYVGLSNYNGKQTKKMYKYFKELNVPYIISQPSYSMLNRWIEDDSLLDVQEEVGAGTVCFSVLAQGKLSNKYIDGIPEESRAKDKNNMFLNEKEIDENLRQFLISINSVAIARKQTINELALCYVLNDKRITSAIMGVRTLKQLKENIKVLDNLELSKDEMKILKEAILKYEKTK